MTEAVSLGELLHEQGVVTPIDSVLTPATAVKNGCRQPRSKRPGCWADNESHYKPPVKAILAARLPQTN